MIHYYFDELGKNNTNFLFTYGDKKDSSFLSEK
jgi:hypothetical protein